MIYADDLSYHGYEGIINVKFKYHPLYVEAMKKVPTARYDRKTDMWTFRAYYRADFERATKDFLVIWDRKEYEIVGMQEDKIPEYPVVPGYSVTYDEDGKVIEWTGFKTRPYGKFQVRGFNALVTRRHLLLADDTGLGKTAMTIYALEALKKAENISHGLVICKASLIYNWAEEIQIHSDLKAVPIIGTKSQRQKIYEYLLSDNTWTVAIISYETFKADLDILKRFSKRKSFDFCVLDEAQKIKNPHSKIGIAIHEIPFKYKYALTATPMPNNLLEIYNYAKWFGYNVGNYYQFRNFYGIMGGYNNKEVIGYKNMRALTNLLKSIMLRRLKKDKLKELPDISFKVIKVEMGREQQKYYDAVKNEIVEILRTTKITNATALAKLTRLQQVTDYPPLIGASAPSAKLAALDELVESMIESKEKVIIFSKFRSIVEMLEQRYKKYNPAVIHGEIDAKERQNQVKKFQNDKSCWVFIGSSPACREGITLTAATNVIFFDLEWTPADVEQAYSRAYRIGQKNAVNVYFLITKNSIDEHVLEVINIKNHVAQSVMGTNENTIQTETIRDLIYKTLMERIEKNRHSA